MKVRWTPQAAAELEEIDAYLRRERPLLAQPTIQKLYLGVQSLRRMSGRGRAGAQPGTIELLLLPLPYVIVYRVHAGTVEILGFRHTSQDVVIH